MAAAGKAGMAAFDAPADRREEFGWVFETLFRAVSAAEDGVTPKLHVPDTVLFSRGQPKTWIGTDASGHLVNKYYPRMNPAADSASVVQHRMKAIRFAFMEFHKFPDNARDRATSPICTVFYLDGTQQVLDVETFDQLSEHALWLVQVLAMQAYVVMEVHHTVQYTMSRGVTVPEGTGPGLEPTMLSVIKLLHDTYTTDAFHAKEVYGLPRVRPRVQVLRCKAVLKRDVNGILWFMFFEEMVTRRTEQEKPVFRRDKAAEQWADKEVQLAADAAERELRELLKHALERGISLRRSFKHFDVAKCNMIHPKDFVSGLKLLGIDIHPAAAHALAARIPVNRVSLIGPEQFIIWCQTGDPPLHDVPRARPTAHSHRRARTRSAGSASTGDLTSTPASPLRRGKSATSLRPIQETHDEDPRGSSLGSVRALARLETLQAPADNLPVRHFGQAAWVGEDADGLGGTMTNATDTAGTTASSDTSANMVNRLGKPRAPHDARREAKQKARRRRSTKRKKALTLRKARERLQGIPDGFVGFRDTWFSNKGSLLDFEDDYKLDASDSSSDGEGGKLLKLPKWARPSTKRALEMVRAAERRKQAKQGGNEDRAAKRSRRRKGGSTRRSRGAGLGATTGTLASGGGASARSLFSRGSDVGGRRGSAGGSTETKEEKPAAPLPPSSPIQSPTPGVPPPGKLGRSSSVRFQDEEIGDGERAVAAGRSAKTPVRRTRPGGLKSPASGATGDTSAGAGGGRPTSVGDDRARFVGGVGRPLSRSSLRSPPRASGAIKFHLNTLKTIGGTSSATLTERSSQLDPYADTTPRGGHVAWVTDNAAVTYRVQNGPPLPPPEDDAMPPKSPLPGTLLTAQGGEPGYPFLTDAVQPGSPKRAPGVGGGDGSLSQRSTFGLDGDADADAAETNTNDGAYGGVPPRTPNRPRMPSNIDDRGRVTTPVGRAAADLAAQKRGLKLDDVLQLYRHRRPVDVLVLPGLFDSPADLAELFHPLTQVLNGCRFLYPSLPGQPGTTWDSEQTLDSAFLASCMMSLIDDKAATGLWGDTGLPDSATERDIIIVGFGVGAHLATVLATDHFQRESHARLGAALRGLLLFNTYAEVDAPLEKCLKRIHRLHRREGKDAQRRGRSKKKKKRRKKKKQQQQGSARTGRSSKKKRGSSRGSSAGSEAEAEAARSETLLHLSSILFSPEYMHKVTRGEAMKTYKYYHQDLVVGRPAADLGVAQLALGARSGASVKAALGELAVPVILVCSTEDTLVLPAHTRRIEAERRRHETGSTSRATELQDILRAEPDALLTHVMYLKSGHQVTQERRTLLPKLLERFIVGRMETGVPKPPPPKPKPKPAPFADDLAKIPPGIYWGPPKAKREIKAEKRPTTIMGLLNAGYGGAVHVGKTSIGKDTESVKRQLEERNLPTDGSPYELLNRLEAALEAERAEAQARIAASKAESREKNAAVRAKRIADAKAARHAHRREMNRIRNQSEAEVLRAAQFTAQERESQRREAALMAIEDERVLLHRRYIARLARQKAASKAAKRNVRELQVHRMNEEQEERLRVQEEERAEFRAERRRKAEEIREKIANESVELPGDTLGYGLDSEDFGVLAEGVTRLLEDVSEMRVRQDRAVTRWRRLDTRLKALKAEKQTLESELDSINRAITASMREANAMLKYGGGGDEEDMDDAVIEAAKAEQEELREKREDVIPILDAVRAHLTLSLGEMDGVNRNVQRISTAARRKEEQLRAMRMKLGRMIVARRQLKRQRLVDQERNVAEVGETELAIQNGRNRLKELKKEYARVKKVKTKTCTTRVWQRNVAQTIRTKELRRFLRKDIRALAKTVGAAEGSLADKQVAAEQAGVDAADAEKAVARLQKYLKQLVQLQKEWEEANNQNLEQGSAREIALRWNHMMERRMAEQAQAVADIEDQGGIIHELGVEFTDKSQTRVTPESRPRLLVRWKPANERSQDEKEWVAADKVMFPQFYRQLSDIDEQAYAEDPAYRAPMKKEALLRLFHLPRPHMSGLGLLRNAKELRLYDLMQTYSHGLGWEMLRLRDQQSGAISAAEAAMARGWVARIKTPQQRSLEEAEWVSIDRVLRPELYDEERRREAAAAARREAERKARENPVVMDNGDTELLDGQVTMTDIRKDAKAHFRFLMERKKAAAQRKALLRQQRRNARKLMRDPDPIKYWRWLGGKRLLGRKTSIASTASAFSLSQLTSRSLHSAPSAGSMVSEAAWPVEDVDEELAQPLFTCELSQAQLRSLLRTPPVLVRSDRKRRILLLMRAYGSDDGAAIRANAEATITPVVRNIHAFPDAVLGIEDDLRQRQEVSFLKEVAFGSVGAAAHTAAQGVVMLQSEAVEKLLDVTEHTLELGQTHEHVFEIPAGLNVSDLTVHITYRGDFDGRGFVVGRLAAGMYRLPLADPDVVAQAHHTVDLAMLATGPSAAVLSGALGDGAPGLSESMQPSGDVVEAATAAARAALGAAQRQGVGSQSQSMAAAAAATAMEVAAYKDADGTYPQFGGVVPGGDRTVLQLKKLPGLPGYSGASPPPLTDAGGMPVSYRPVPPVTDVPVDMVAALRRVAVGYPVVPECRMNTPDTLGRTVFRHEPLHLPVLPGRYSVQLTGLARTHYSVSVVAQRVYTAEQAIEAAVKNAIHAKGRIPECRVELEDLNLALRLGKWKYRLVQDLIATTEAHMKATNHVLHRLRKALEKGEVVRKDLGPLGSDTSSNEDEEETTSSEEDSDETETESDETETESDSDWTDSDEETETETESDDEDEETAADRLKRRARRKIEVTEKVHHRITERIAKLEEDYAAIVNSLRTRKQELKDIQDGLNEMLQNKKLREAEIEELELTLNKYKREIPRVVTALRGESDEELRRRKKVAILRRHGISHRDIRTEMVTSLGGEQLTRQEMDINRFGRRVVSWLDELAKAGLHEGSANTPAEKVRRKILDDLTKEEREWMAMDRVLHPDRYRDGDDEFADAMDKETMQMLQLADAEMMGVQAGAVHASPADAGGTAPSVAGVRSRATSVATTATGAALGGTGGTGTGGGGAGTTGGGGGGGGGGGTVRPTQVSVADEVLGAAGVEGSSMGAARKGKGAAAGMPGSKEAKARVGKTKYDRYLPNCTYTKEELKRIQESPVMDLTQEEIPVKKLLNKYHDRPPNSNYDYDPWADPGTDDEDSKKGNMDVPPRYRDFGDKPLQKGMKVRDLLMQRAERLAKQRELAASRKQGIINFKAIGTVISRDVDKRCKQLLAELDRAYASRKKFMDSPVLHNTQQRFPVPVLRKELERELDRLLLGQVFEREHIYRQDYNTKVLKLRHQLQGETEEQAEERKRREAARRAFLADRAAVAITTTKTYGPKAKATVRRAQMAAAAARAARAFGEAEDGGSDDEEFDDPVRLLGQVIKWGATRKPLSNEERAKTGVANSGGLGAKKRREALARAKMREARKLGPGGCLACQAAPCRWKPSIDVAKEAHRKRIVERELDRIERLPEGTKFLVTEVPLSVQRGGANRLPVQDFKDELLLELAVLQRRLRLHEVDEELHRAYASHADHLETTVLHGYQQMSWRKDAIVALEREMTRHMARNVAVDIVDDILDWMLEGWHFGERQSELPLAGFIPSIRNDRPLRPAEARSQAAKELAATGKAVDFDEQFEEGKLPRVYADDKWAPVDVRAHRRAFVTKAMKAGSAVEENMNETERTLKFGLFMLALMYFRSMNQLREQRDLWSGDGQVAKVGGHGGKDVTEERSKMLESERNRTKRQRAIKRAFAKADVALSRKAKLEAEERAKARRKLYATVRRRAVEEDSAGRIQAAYRGHLARIAVRKWAIKKRELDAIRALRLAAAINIQRMWRGYTGRLIVKDRRKELTAFLRMLRAQEEQELQEDFYATNTIERWKRDWRRWRGKEKVFEEPEQAFAEAKYEADSEDSDESGGSEADEAETDSDAGSGDDEDDEDDGENKGVEGSGDGSADGGSDHESDHGSDHGSDNGSDNGSEHGSDNGSDHGSEHGSEHGSGGGDEGGDDDGSDHSGSAADEDSDNGDGSADEDDDDGGDEDDEGDDTDDADDEDAEDSEAGSDDDDDSRRK